MTVRRTIVITLVLIAVIAVVLVVRLSEVVVTIDQDGPPVPDWLPPAITDLHVRGWPAGCGFSGRCTQAAWTAWVERSRLPLVERRQGELSWKDYGAVPVSAFRVTPPSPVRRELGEGEELVFGDGDDWPGDRPYLRIHYLPASGILYGNRIDP